MPINRCCVCGCNNDSRYPDKQVKRSNVKELKFQYFPKDPKKENFGLKKWRGLLNFTVSNIKVVCAIHFTYEKPTFASPIPTMYMNV